MNYKNKNIPYKIAVRYARSYGRWKAEYSDILANTQKLNVDFIRSGSFQHKSRTEETALILAELSKKIKMVEDAAREADPFCWQYILLSVSARPGAISYEKLKEKGMDCEKKAYYYHRRRFYLILEKKIKQMLKRKYPADRRV